MTWKCGLVVGFLVLVMGIAVGVLLRHAHNAKQVEGLLLERLSELTDERELARFEAAAAKAEADDYRAQRDATRDLLAESRARVSRLLKKKPRTLPECMEGLQTAQQHIALLDRELMLSDAEVTALRKSIAMKDYEIQHLEDIIALQEERVKIWKKATRSQKVKRAFFGIGMFVAGVGGGYALAVATQ